VDVSHPLGEFPISFFDANQSRTIARVHTAAAEFDLAGWCTRL
jgi:hypothetical protein